MQTLLYEECGTPDSFMWAEAGMCEPHGRSEADTTIQNQLRKELAEALAQETQRIHDAYSRGIQDGRVMERESAATARLADEARLREQLLAALERVEKDRKEYFEAVEHEVVQLALAVAARILQRESQIDPLLLTSAVRGVLQKIPAATDVHLRVPRADVDSWRESIGNPSSHACKVAIEGEDGLSAGDCIIETILGSVDIGVAPQIAEIERALFTKKTVAASIE